MSRSITKLWNYSLVPGTFKSHFGDEIPYLWKVNLREIWSHSPSEFPGCPEDNVIYCIHNDKNGKCYVGQARNLFNRFINSYSFSHYDRYVNNSSEIIYKAINKYGSSLFTIYILDELGSPNELNDKEIYWISVLHSSIYDKLSYGYNMNSGGTNHEQLDTDEARIKAYNTNLKNHGGVLAINTKQAYETNRKNHGGVLAWNTPESQAKSIKTRAEKWNGDCMGACHTEEVLNSMRDENGNLPINTPESKLKARESILRLYNGDRGGMMHTPEAILKTRITKFINLFNKHLELLNKLNLEFNYYNLIRGLPNDHNHNIEYIDSIWDRWANAPEFHNNDRVPLIAKKFIHWLEQFNSWNELNNILDDMERTGKYY